MYNFLAHLPNISPFKELWLMVMFMTRKTIYSSRLKFFLSENVSNLVHEFAGKLTEGHRQIQNDGIQFR